MIISIIIMINDIKTTSKKMKNPNIVSFFVGNTIFVSTWKLIGAILNDKNFFLKL